MNSYPKELRLTGDFYCRLTDQQRNTWHEYTLSLPKAKQLQLIHIKIEAYFKALTNPSIGVNSVVDEIVRLSEEAYLLEKDLHYIAKTWYETQIEESK